MPILAMGRKGRPRQTHCLRGHEYNKKNTRWSIGSTGKPQRSCYTCVLIRAKLRYRNDATFREAKKKYKRDHHVWKTAKPIDLNLIIGG